MQLASKRLVFFGWRRNSPPTDTLPSHVSPHLFALIAAVTIGAIGYFTSDGQDLLKAVLVGVLFYGVAWILATGAQRLKIKGDKEH